MFAAATAVVVIAISGGGFPVASSGCPDHRLDAGTRIAANAQAVQVARRRCRPQPTGAELAERLAAEVAQPPTSVTDNLSIADQRRLQALLERMLALETWLSDG